MSRTVADVMVQTVSEVGGRCCYGVPADAPNFFTDALLRSGHTRFVHARHEEVGAFAAAGVAGALRP
ncbi:MAG: thiamine pyrophosphate-binding protein [Candidatus Binataceae bacterium]